jgi:Reverse transcriptase (RNA-dependent DNA polymerase)
MALAAILGFNVWSYDVRQAYLQAATPLLRDVYVQTDALSLKKGELLRLLKPPYGLSDSGDYWARTLSNFHLEQLCLQQSTGDFSLFFRIVANKIVGLSSSYVDDLLQAGTTEFRADMEKQFNKAFEMAPPQKGSFTFAGIQVETSPGLRLHQNGYIDRLSTLPATATFDDFRTQRATIAWITHTRPDICCAISFAAQVTQASFKIKISRH